MSAITAPGATSAPSGATIRRIPPASATTSTVVLSVSTSTSGSPTLTASPSRRSQREITAVSIESETRGIRSSVT